MNLKCKYIIWYLLIIFMTFSTNCHDKPHFTSAMQSVMLKKWRLPTACCDNGQQMFILPVLILRQELICSIIATFGKVKYKPARPAKLDKKKEREGELDTNDKIDMLYLKKADIDQVTYFRCHNSGHFAGNCKGKHSASASLYYFMKPCFANKNNIIFYIRKDIAWNDLNNKKRNEGYDYTYDNYRYQPSQSSDSSSPELDNEEENRIMYLELSTLYEYLKA